MPLVPRRSRNSGDLQDPLILVLETESGAVIDDEISVNIRYGDDIRGEIVGEESTVALVDSHPVIVRRAGGVGRGLKALHEGGRVPVVLRAGPELYG